MGLAASRQPLIPPQLYRPRNVRATPLYQLLEAYYEDVKAIWEERFQTKYGFWRGFADQVVARYLDCGVAEAGFARLKCNTCGTRGGAMQYHGADLVGIGASSFSHVGGVNQQNRAFLTSHLDASFRGELPLWRAYRLSARQRLVRELILQLKLGRVERRHFREKFECDVVASFAGPLEQARRRGWLTIGDEALTLTREGLVRVDRWLPAFYSPEHRNVRYS